MRLPRVAIALVLVGAALVLAGVLVGPAAYGMEGASFTRAAGTPAYSGIFSEWNDGGELLSPVDGNLWLGAGLACLVLAAGAMLAHRAGLRVVRAER